MRSFGGLLLLIGIVAFLYSSARMSGLEPVPDGVAIGDYLRYEAGKWELGRYLGLSAALIGILLAVFPKGR